MYILSQFSTNLGVPWFKGTSTFFVVLYEWVFICLIKLFQSKSLRRDAFSERIETGSTGDGNGKKNQNGPRSVILYVVGIGATLKLLTMVPRGHAPHRSIPMGTMVKSLRVAPIPTTYNIRLLGSFWFFSIAMVFSSFSDIVS
ncbi:hypothetical protein B9Z55_002982 [Caenorhabditis nigoni]|uniref:Uncharacterized protein n=1 Tax=Caenorhabditis nigoni TaxID=1611254 RepID=A0A2G5VNF6_9PELO|nr:hypothetical protein B9Z55_002982 [Caenorhabditis nigoni]